MTVGSTMCKWMELCNIKESKCTKSTKVDITNNQWYHSDLYIVYNIY